MQTFINSYYTTEGKLFRKKDGKEVGWTCPQGYLKFDHKGRKYQVHRAIFLLHYGYLPDLVDHIDRDKKNNLPENLRELDKRGNALNTNLRKDNTSGYKGISWNKNANKWAVCAYFMGKKKHLGYFSSIEDAIKTRDNYSQIH